MPTWQWVVISLISGCCMGTGSFVYATNFAKYGFVGNGVLGPGNLIVCLLVKLAIEFRYYYKHKRWFKERNSTWLRADGSFYFYNSIAALANALTNDGYLIVMTIAWKFAKKGGINQGMISTLLSFASVFNLFLFKFFFN